MKERGKLVIWPAYIDKTKTRNQGRIISRKKSVKEPHLSEIEVAATELGLNPEVEADKKYPRSWWERSGRILVDNTEPKTKIARLIADSIKKKRNTA
ncbi:signal recognition particle protein Srp19 [Methanosalsum natronophilum]|uniref:Signal recognition particle 19 kDa protein n=1 Tax=Methanosalsum natronophilum TaxID=768733 RepID=A0A3R7VTG2_9EURY|nr:signal recognition particle protein Srp19 [Methanosalsum natronophilum]MCS3923752.1 signal recognition particle subunit SRP19 [Methanosalsum natronophilum]RQD85230.1 MAG: signal recognition particle protein Srp19 [Methanosalsum natronophilum]